MLSTRPFWANTALPSSFLITGWCSFWLLLLLLLQPVSAQEHHPVKPAIQKHHSRHLRSRHHDPRQLWEAADEATPTLPQQQLHHHHHRKLQRAVDRRLAVPDQYLVLYGTDVSQQEVHTKFQELLADCEACQAVYEYHLDMNGYAVSHLPKRFLRQLLQDPAVERVEEDQIVQSAFVQDKAIWNLDRLDGHEDGTYEYSSTGRGVIAFIVDSGITTTHPEFDGGRASCGWDVYEADCLDEQGHGSHVAGIAGGKLYGVAKDLELVGVRVLDAKGRGKVSSVVKAIDYIISRKLEQPRVPMVANLSLGGNPSVALDSAVQKAVNAGIVFVIAAGNEDEDACGKSPSRVSQAITVGASSQGNKVSSFSNYGGCVDIFGPGERITAAWGTGGSRPISGTSMASPHIVGAAALYLEDNPRWSPARVWNAMKSDAVTGILTDLKDSSSPNRVISTGGMVGSRGIDDNDNEDNEDLATEEEEEEDEAMDCTHMELLGRCDRSDACCEVCLGVCWMLKDEQPPQEQQEEEQQP